MTPSPSFNPFPGLRPFRESESHLFFGRSTHVDEVLAELARSRFVAVMGASGSGKSSLVAAGVLPMLHGGFSARAGSHWRIATFRPGANPIHNLARSLALPEVLGPEKVEPLLATAQVEATLRRSGLGLADAARRSEQLGDGRLLVVVDQFEELFRFHAGAEEHDVHPDGQRFVQLLVEATRDGNSPVDVIITMRSDFLGDCSRFRDLPEVINQGLYLVPRLTRGQLREAFTAPAAVGGAVLSPRLVQRLLNDAGADPDMLPVMQHAMMRTWETWVGAGAFGVIDIEHYEACGGADDALSRHADEAYFELADDRRRSIAELMFKRITELGDDRRETRRPASLAEIAAVADATPAEVEECIAHFSEHGRSFVTVSADGIVDISHESLIRQWPRLTAWTQDEAASRDVYRRLADAADRWGRGEAALLHDPDLQIVARWWADTEPTQAWAERYDPAFERASQYLARSRRSARRRRTWMAVGVAALAILAVTAALLAVRANRARDEAQRERRTAVSRQLASESIATATASRTTSVLSALEAVELTQADGLRIPAAEEALRSALNDPLSVRLPSSSGQVGHTGAVRTVAFSPDGSLLATGGDDHAVLLWSPAALDAEPRALQPLPDGVGALAFSPDGRWLAAGSDDGTAMLWDVTEPGTKPRTLQDHEDGITALAFSPDGSLLATASRDGRAILRSVGDAGVPPQILTGHDGFVLSMAFSPDGRQLVTGGGDGFALVRAVEDLTAEPVRLDHGGDVTAVAFSPDGRSVATASTDGTVKLWGLDGTQGDVLAHRGPVRSLAFSPDGSLLATGSDDSTARVWDLDADGGPAANPVVLQHTDAVAVVAFSPDGRRLATASRDHTAQLFDVDDLDADPLVLSGHDGPVTTMAFSNDARWLATGSDDATARLWDMGDPFTNPAVLSHGVDSDGATVGVKTVAFSPDGRQMATGASDKKVRIWDVDDLTAPPVVIEHDTVEGYEKAGITALAFSPDGGQLATGSGDRYVRVWDLADPAAPPAVSPQFDEMVTALAFAPDERSLAVGINDTTAFVWDLSNPDSEPTPLSGHTDAITSVAFSPGGETLAIGSRDGDVHLRATADLSAEPVVLDGSDDITSLAFSREGHRLATGSTDATVQVWDLDADPATVMYVLETDDPVSSVAFSPDGRTLVVAAGRTVQLWDLAAPDPTSPIAKPTVLRDHAATVNAVAYSPTGDRFASASEDGTARVWLPLDELIDLGCDFVGRNFTRPEWDALLPGEPYRSTCDEWPAAQ